jgi:hypothetical protein
VRHGLDAEYAFAFGLDLERQSAAMQFEDRQIIRRSLDRDFPLSRSALPLSVLGTMLTAQDGLDSFQVRPYPATINQGLEYLLHLAPDFEPHVPAVLDLEVRVWIAKPTALLVFQI